MVVHNRRVQTVRFLFAKIGVMSDMAVLQQLTLGKS